VEAIPCPLRLPIQPFRSFLRFSSTWTRPQPDRSCRTGRWSCCQTRTSFCSRNRCCCHQLWRWTRNRLFGLRWQTWQSRTRSSSGRGRRLAGGAGWSSPGGGKRRLRPRPIAREQLRLKLPKMDIGLWQLRPPWQLCSCRAAEWRLPTPSSAACGVSRDGCWTRLGPGLRSVLFCKKDRCCFKNTIPSIVYM